MCAFSNEPGLDGGALLLGAVQRDGELWPTYEVVGVNDADQIQSDLASQCASSFNIPIRPRMTVESVEGKNVIVVEVDEVADSDKPVYFKSTGLPRGAYRRVGPTDQKCTEDDLIVFYQQRGPTTSDELALNDATLSDIDPEAVDEYRRLRRVTNPEAEELGWNDQELLEALFAIKKDGGEWKPTTAGILLFGTTRALRRLFPMMRIDYIRVPGKEWVSDPSNRFQAIEIRAPLLVATRRAHAAVRDDLPKAFNLPEGEIQREELPLLPDRVLREAIVNAVIHRTYRVHGAVQIIRYANRLEIRNPGHSLTPDDRLGQPGSQTRNPRIAAVFHETGLAETKGSGIRVMRELMSQSHLSAPTFESQRDPDQFVATLLFHHFLDESDLAWLQQFQEWSLTDDDSRALVFAREMGAINNTAYRDLNRVDTLTASQRLRRLRDHGILAMKGRGPTTYYELADPFLDAGDESKASAGSAQAGLPETQVHGADTQELPPQSAPDTQELGPNTQEFPPQSAPDTQELGPNTQEFPPQSAPNTQELEPDAPLSVVQLSELPVELAEAVTSLSGRAREGRVRALLVRLCGWRPMTAQQLAGLLGRQTPHLVRKHLSPMVESGELAYTYPEIIQHPRQAYQIPTPERKP